MAFFEYHGVEVESFHISHLRNFTFPLHFHPAYELIIVNEGTLSVTIDQKHYSLHQNDAVFIFNNQLHEFKSIGSSEITIIIFSPEIIGHFFMNFKNMIPENNKIQLEAPPNLSMMDSIYRKKSFLYGSCGALVEQTMFIPIDHSTQTKILHRILVYVDKNFTKECTLKAIARDLQYDYAYLSKLFIQMTTITFTDYLINYRISQACYLLKNSNHTITEIADQCGYNNLRSFNRNFKKVTQFSPMKYRAFYQNI